MPRKRKTRTPNTRPSTEPNKGLKFDVMKYRGAAFPTLVYRALITEIGVDITNYININT